VGEKQVSNKGNKFWMLCVVGASDASLSFTGLSVTILYPFILLVEVMLKL